MNKWYKKAEEEVKEAIKDLKDLLPRDGEDISCYEPSALDESLNLLVQAKANMAIGRAVLKKEMEDE